MDDENKNGKNVEGSNVEGRDGAKSPILPSGSTVQTVVSVINDGKCNSRGSQKQRALSISLDDDTPDFILEGEYRKIIFPCHRCVLLFYILFILLPP